MIRQSILALLGISSLAAAQVKLQFGTLPFYGVSAINFSQVLQLPNTDQIMVGTMGASRGGSLDSQPVQHSQITLTALGGAPFRDQPDATGKLGGSGNDVPRAAAVDSLGNVWIAGDTDSDDFNLVNPILSRKVPYRTAGFILELDPTGNHLLFATYLAGQQASPLPTAQFAAYATHATAITTDGGGNVFVGGSTDEADFPTTPGAFLSGQGGADVFGNTRYYSFVLKISPAGKLIYSTLLGTGASLCSGGSRCIAQESTFAGVSSLAASAAGQLAVAGLLGGSLHPGAGYVSRVGTDGSNVLWSTPAPNYWGIRSIFMAQDPGGNLDLFGQYATIVTTNPLFPTLGTPGLFAGQLKADGSAFIYLTDLGLSPDASAAGIAVDGSGNAWLAGTSSSAQFPTLAGVPDLGPDFAIRLDATGTRAEALFRFPHGTVTGPPAFDAAGNLLLPSAQGALLTIPPTYSFDTPALVGFANSASLAFNTGLYPGALLTLFGFDLATSASDAQVLVDGLPALVLFAGPNQINVQLPFGLALSSGGPHVQITSSSGNVSQVLPFTQSIGLFTVDGAHTATLNQDGSVNSASNPALRGSVVSLFGTGVQWPSGMTDGALAAAAEPLNQEINRLQMVDNTGTPLSIWYAGEAPGLINGVFQINVQLPAKPANLNQPLLLRAATNTGSTITSNPVQIYVQ